MPEPTITGRVVDDVSGDAYPGVTVRLFLRAKDDRRPGLEGAEYAGSVETDEQGSFFFTTSRAQEGRLFLLAVFADGGGTAAKPLAETPLRPFAARMKPVLLRVSHGASRESSAEGSAFRWSDASARAKVTEAQMEGLRKGAGERLRGALGRRAKGRQLGLGLAGARKGRQPNRLVQAGRDPAEALEAARTEGLRRFDGSPARGLRVHLDDGLRARLTEILGHDPEEGGTIPHPAFLQVREALRAGSGAGERVRSLLDECRSRMTLAASAVGGDDATPDAPPPGVDSVGAAATGADPATARLEDLISALIEALHDEIPGVSSRPGPDEIEEALTTRVALGPADTTAFYDFHTLQVAWEDTWTAVLDGNVPEAIADIYDAIVQVVEPAAVDELLDDEVHDLESFVAGMSRAVAETAGSEEGGVPAELTAWVPAIAERWMDLTVEQQLYLKFLYIVDRMSPVINSGLVSFGDSPFPAAWFDELPRPIRSDWAEEQARHVLEDAKGPSLGRLRRLIDGLQERLREPYRFDVFVADSYNFGIVTTYRQRWQPLAYQVGDLVSTIPLAPGETRSYTKKSSWKESTSRAESRSRSSQRNRSSDQELRTEGEIVDRASQSGRFSTGTSGDVDIGIFGGTANFEASAELSHESARTKRDIRNAVLKAAQEYRDEHKVDVSTSRERSGEWTETATISNPNNEITVTYLFYELQRRYEISEQLHRLAPVVLVAFEVPAPHEIDEDWLLAYEWVVRPALLDPSLAPVFNLLREGLVGRELAAEVLKRQWETQLTVVAAIRDNVAIHGQFRDTARDALRQATNSVPDNPGIEAKLFSVIYGDQALEDLAGAEIETKSELAARREAARLALDWADADFHQAGTRLEAAVTALHQATEAYSAAVKERLEARVRVDQLRIHVKQNILHYVQAIWRSEHRDQRYLRLYDLPIQWPEPASGGYRLVSASTAKSGVASWPKGERYPHLELLFPEPELGKARPLGQIADLDNLLGFKGNYGIFPLRSGNALTDYMSQGFLDSYFGVLDPDPSGDLPTTTEALELAECAWTSAGTSDADRTAIVDWLTEVLQTQRRRSEVVVVPSGQLFIEALPGSHPLLEDFKLKHRALDVERARHGLDTAKIETLRRLMRLAEGALGAPDADRRVEVSGASEVSVDVDAGS